MRVLAVVHQPDAGPGVFGDEIRARGDELEEWRPPDSPVPPVVDHDAVIVLGGAMNVDEEESHPWLVPEKALLHELVGRGVPMLGVCLGAQLLADATGGEARRASRPEIGWGEVRLEAAAAGDPVLGALPPRFESFQWHGYEAVPPPGATVLARSDVCAQAYRLDARPAWGVQFHAEVSADIVERWIRDYAKDPDAVRIGLDPDRLRAQTEPAIGEWNELGRALCGRFLDAAAAATAA